VKLGCVRPLDPQEWVDLLERSPQRTVFLEPEFVGIFDVPFRFWGLERKGVVIAGLAVIEAERLGGRFLPWCYYQGIVFHEEVWRAAPAKRTQYEIEITEDLVTGVAREESHFSLSLHPMLGDVRGLDWVHYHEPDWPRIRLLPRYTAIRTLSGETRESIRLSARSARRQEEGYAQSREGVLSAEDGTVEELVGLYRQTFERQGVEPSAVEMRLLPVYAGFFLASGRGKLLAVRRNDGTACAIALVFSDRDGTVHLPVVGTGDTRFGGTLLYFDILDRALSEGAPKVDFNGANSPNRAYFKHSIGAGPVLYFEATYEASGAG
jgi:hypothetical protein